MVSVSATRQRWASLLLIALLAGCSQSTPEIDALEAFMRQKSVETCAIAAGTMVHAHQFLQTDPSAEAVSEKLMSKYQKTSEKDPRLKKMMLAHAQFAYLFRELGEDTMAIAYFQICRLLATPSHPHFPNIKDDSWLVRILEAEKCEKQHGAGKARKECVAKVFPAGLREGRSPTRPALQAAYAA